MAFFSGLRRILDPSLLNMPQARTERDRGFLPPGYVGRKELGEGGGLTSPLHAKALELHPLLGPHGQARVDAALADLFQGVTGVSERWPRAAATNPDGGLAYAPGTITGLDDDYMPATDAERPAFSGHPALPGDQRVGPRGDPPRETLTRGDRPIMSSSAPPEVELNSAETLRAAPALRGLNAQVRDFLNRMAPRSDVARYLRQRGLAATDIADIIRQYQEHLQFRRRNPSVRHEPAIDLERYTETLNPLQSEFASLAQSSLGAYVIAAGNAATDNNLDALVELTGADGELANRGMSLVREQNPVSSIVGDVGGAASLFGLARRAMGRGIGRAAREGIRHQSRPSSTTGARRSSPPRRSSRTGRSTEPYEVDPREVERYIRQGHSLDEATHLAKPYSGMGEHFIARRRNFPNWFTNSRFNVLRPPNITRGRMYELHYKVDPDFHGAYFPRYVSDRGWSGARAGLQKYGPAGRLWYGSPRPLKIAAGGTGAAVGGGAYLMGDEEDD